MVSPIAETTTTTSLPSSRAAHDAVGHGLDPLHGPDRGSAVLLHDDGQRSLLLRARRGRRPSLSGLGHARSVNPSARAGSPPRSAACSRRRRSSIGAVRDAARAGSSRGDDRPPSTPSTSAARAPRTRCRRRSRGSISSSPRRFAASWHQIGARVGLGSSCGRPEVALGVVRVVQRACRVTGAPAIAGVEHVGSTQQRRAASGSPP